MVTYLGITKLVKQKRNPNWHLCNLGSHPTGLSMNAIPFYEEIRKDQDLERDLKVMAMDSFLWQYHFRTKCE